MSHWQYLLLLAACVAVTLPLELVGGARVYRSPLRLVATLVPVVVLFGSWDVLAVHHGDWRYSASDTLGVRLLSLPIEEWLFFLVVPVCALLTYEVLGRPGRCRAR
jgi:lycopene beta-cyclase